MPNGSRSRDPGVLAQLYADGVRAAAEGSRLADPTDPSPAWRKWPSADVARHLLVVAGWYHQWLDRAIGGDPSPPFGIEDFDAQNEAALASLEPMAPQEAAGRFERTAMGYLERALQHLHLPYGFPYGTVTVELHLGAAAAEWNLHAWDLNRAHVPNDPAGLFTAVARCMAATEPPLKRALLTPVIPLGARLSPWATLLRRSERMR